jgi:hypothetical protein
MHCGKLIFDNKPLLNYILEFDDTYKQKFKKDLVFTRDILEAAHLYWYNRYERELFWGGSGERSGYHKKSFILSGPETPNSVSQLSDYNIKLLFQLQDAYFDTLFLWDSDLIEQIGYDN